MARFPARWGSAHPAMGRWHVESLKWRYLALFGTVLKGAYVRKPSQITS